MKTTFDINRFMSLMKYEVMSETRQYVRKILSAALAISLFFGLQLYFKRGEMMDVTYGSNYYSNISGVMFLASIFVLFIYACNIFQNMLVKQQRISFLSLPASNLEKFLARLLWVNIAGLMVCIGTWCIADLCQMIVSMALGIGDHGSLIGKFTENLGSGTFNVNGVNHSVSYLWIAFFSFQVFLQASGTFFGTLFRKQPWIWTMAIHIVVGVVIVKILSSTDIAEHIFDALGFQLSYWIFIVTQLCLSLAMYYGGYILFKRMQVINNKWVNL